MTDLEMHDTQGQAEIRGMDGEPIRVERESEMPDKLAPARGIAYGLLFSVPIWVCIFWVLTLL